MSRPAKALPTVAASQGEDASLAFARNVVRTRFEDLPPAAVRAARANIMDGIAGALAATTTTPAGGEMAELAKELGGKPEASLIGFGGKVPAHMAAWVNAALVHSLNYNDIFDAYWSHPGGTLLPVALASAERAGRVSGKEFLTAYVLGLDMMGRLGRAVFPPKPVRDWASYGWLPPQIFGYFGGAAVAGRLLGLTETQQLSAFGLAYSQAAGNMEPLFGVGADKGIYQSYPAQQSILSVLMAQKGIAGAPRSLEGKAGLFRLFFHGEYDPEALTADLGRRYMAEELGMYAFPCCGYTQAYVAETLKLVREKQIRPADVESVTLFVGPRAMNLCEPREVRCSPRNISEAQMSIPFTVATAIAKGTPRIEHFTPQGLRDPEILAMAAKVRWQADPACDKSYGTAIIDAGVEIGLKGGRNARFRYHGVRYGHPQNPIGEAELKEKYRDCMPSSAKPMTAAATAELISTLDRLESLEDVSPILQMIA